MPIQNRVFAVIAAFPLAMLVGVASLGGIFFAGTYARETANWAAQGIGQDYFDLFFAVPWLAISAVLALRGSRRALFLLAGGYLYTVYEFAIYAFAVHFNALFPVYCATLGLSFFALAGVGALLVRQNAASWYVEPIPRRTAGLFLVAVGVLFGVAWLGEILGAIAHGTAPKSVLDAGAATNPVHVLDLSVVLPLYLVAGVALLRQRPIGWLLAPVLMSFGVLMSGSIVALMFVMRGRGFDVSGAVLGGMTAVATASGVVLVLLVRRLRPSSSVPART
ncbi:MAG: hypothetical protein QOI66_3692 [Myxococcales bacterium]|jgi:hypothetical protein|nr:hypothetical protein [Myxococcales bacterium]